MPAKPARPIDSPTVIDGGLYYDHAGEMLALEDLSRAELMRAVGLSAETATHGRIASDVRREGNAEIRNLLRGAYGLPADPSAVATFPTADADEPEPDDQVSIPPVAPVAPAVTAAPAPAPTGSLDDMLRGMMADVAANVASRSIDADAVRAIVHEAIGARPVIEVKVGQADPVRVEGPSHQILPDLLKLAGARIHTYLAGTPGTGKSHVCHQAADALGLPFAAVSCHPQMTAVALFGYMNATGDYVRTPFREMYEHGGLFLLDEIDNGNAAILAGMNQALSNGTCAFADGMVKRHEDFVLVAAANTWGRGATSQFVGRVAIDAATLDRFFRLEMTIDESLERDLTLPYFTSGQACDDWLATVRQYRRNVESAGLKVFITPRAAIDGAKALRAGFTKDQALRGKVLEGLDAETIRKVVGR